MCLQCGHACLEQGTVESELYICGMCNEHFGHISFFSLLSFFSFFKSYKLLVYNPLSVFRPRLVEGYL